MEALGYIHLRSGALLPPLSLSPFKVAIIAEETADERWRSEVCAWLIGNGCLSLAAWGYACEAWHDDADNINIAEFAGAEIPEDRLVMTTCHHDEPLTEILWFVAAVAFHPTIVLRTTLIIHVAQRERENEIRRLYQTAAADQ